MQRLLILFVLSLISNLLCSQTITLQTGVSLSHVDWKTSSPNVITFYNRV
ncbi:hypothetical protein [Limibacterium fermenti]